MITIYLTVLVLLVWTTLVRQRNTARWRYVAARERAKLRQNLSTNWHHATLSNYNRDVEKLLIAKGARIARDQMGYIHLEIPEMVRWLSWENHGVQELIERAVVALTLQKLQEVLA